MGVLVLRLGTTTLATYLEMSLFSGFVEHGNCPFSTEPFGGKQVVGKEPLMSLAT